MKKYILASVLFLIFTFSAVAAEDPDSAGRLFYKGNSLYEKGQYAEAISEYQKILSEGIASGALYYNIGNSYYKSGKIGYAILYYKKALRLSPADSDLKSNLSYLRSLTEDSALQPAAQNKLAWLVKIPFKEFTINGVARILIIFYLLVIGLMIAGIVNHDFKRKSTFVFYPILILFLLSLAGFSVRYYEEEVITKGIVIVKDAECKYEPIEKSTTYFTLKEGQEVLILKTRNGWRRIKRLDGKLAWVKSDAVEEE